MSGGNERIDPRCGEGDTIRFTVGQKPKSGFNYVAAGENISITLYKNNKKVTLPPPRKFKHGVITIKILNGYPMLVSCWWRSIRTPLGQYFVQKFSKKSQR